MKPVVLMITVFSVALLLGSCSGSDERYEKLKADYDALQEQMAEKDAIVGELILTLGTIEKNLSLLREKEELIGPGSVSREDISPDVQYRIMKEIRELAMDLTENYNKLASLREELARSKIRTDAFRQTVDALNEAILVREGQIDTLKVRLVEMNFEMEELESAIASLHELDSLSRQMILAQATEMNRAWMVVGDEKELLEKGLLEKSGGILGIGSTLKLTGSFRQEHFNEVDARTIASVAFRGKKPRVVTAHPEDSFEMSRNTGNHQLSIEDPEKFWSASRYLVVVTR